MNKWCKINWSYLGKVRIKCAGKQFLLKLSIIVVLMFAIGRLSFYRANAQTTCSASFFSVSEPLNDLGPNEYVDNVRLSAGPTGFSGGLYPNGTNSRPTAHDTAGIAIANQITPLDLSGNSEVTNGKIVMISIGMSNTSFEFAEFVSQAALDSDLNPQLVIVNTAIPGAASNDWLDFNATTWDRVDTSLNDAGVTPEQVQVAWVKLAQVGSGQFPEKAQALQNDLEIITRNLKSHYPNIKLAYYSSRTRSYLNQTGLSPEPVAFETGFAVKWMIEKQINGDPDLNYDPMSGPVVAPYLSWGPYLWIDGLNPRSDSLVWSQADLQEDCVHPSESGIQKVANQLMLFFKTDLTSTPWFLVGTIPEPTVTPTPFLLYLPTILK